MATQPALALVSELEAQINKLKLDLPSKIGITLVIKKLKEEIAKPEAAPIVAPEEPTAPALISDVDAPVNIDTMSLQEKLNAEQKSNLLASAYNQWRSACDILRNNIKAPDKTIITLSKPARINERVTNSFDKNTGVLLMVASTNSEPYALTKGDNGYYSLSAARFWKSDNSVTGDK